MKEITIPIEGMHCRSCEILVGEKLREVPGVTKARVSAKAGKATITTSYIPSGEQISKAVKAAGYRVSTDRQPLVSRDRRIYLDAAIGLAIISVVLMFAAVLNIGNPANLTTAGASIGLVALAVGVTAGFSTCMALIGGLVLGLSARFAERHPTASGMQKFRPHLYFNLGRILSFVVFGALIGAVGSLFQMNGIVLGLLTISVGAVMVLLGLQLTGIFPRLGHTLTLPGKIGEFFGMSKNSPREYSHARSTMLGAATFFLPCGFTQAMQLFAISTGSPVSGAIIMGAFAIGTAPGLLGIGGLTSAVKGAFAARFFRIVGVAVVAMAIINMSSGYNLLGIGSLLPARGSRPTASSAAQNNAVLPATYRLSTGLSPDTFTAKVGEPTVIEVDVKENGQGCMSTIMIPGLVNRPQYLAAGKTIKMSFTPKRAGDIYITCAMGIPHGTLKVVEG